MSLPSHRNPTFPILSLILLLFHNRSMLWFCRGEDDEKQSDKSNFFFIISRTWEWIGAMEPNARSRERRG